MGSESTEFLTKPDLFISANSNVETAKDIFKECKKTVDETYVFLGEDIFLQLERDINASDKAIKGLLDLIETTKQNLLSMPDFCEEYMRILESQMASFNTINITVSTPPRPNPPDAVLLLF